MNTHKIISIPVQKEYLKKSACIVKARMLVSSNQISMDIQECAEEIYAHTVVYYCADSLKKYHINFEGIINHANPIDLEDGGDTKPRKILYKLIWKVIPSR